MNKVQKLTDKRRIKCPHCESIETIQTFQDDTQFIYNCNSCNTQTIIDNPTGKDEDLQVNGESTKLDFEFRKFNSNEDESLLETHYAKVAAVGLIDNGGILVGSQAFRSEETKLKDIDIACTWETYLETLESCEYLRRDNYYMKSHKNSYKKNENTLWNGVETLTFIDGTKLDILFYPEEVLPSITRTMSMMKKEAAMFSVVEKGLRIETYELLLKTMHKYMNKEFKKYNYES